MILHKENMIYIDLFSISQDSMSIARTAVSAASLNGILFSIGGECALAELQDETLYLQCVEAYNPIMMEWSQRAEMQVARSFVAAVAVAGQLYALGKFPFHQVYHLSSNVQSICSKGFCFYRTNIFLHSCVCFIVIVFCVRCKTMT